MSEMPGEATVEQALQALKGFRLLGVMLAAGEVLVLCACGVVVWLIGPVMRGPDGKPDMMLSILGVVIPWAAFLGSWLAGGRWREVRSKSVITPNEMMQVLGGSANISLFVAEGGTIFAIVFFLLTGQWWLVPVSFLPGFLLTISAIPRPETSNAVSR